MAALYSFLFIIFISVIVILHWKFGYRPQKRVRRDIRNTGGKKWEKTAHTFGGSIH
jgi:cbb3-type cytochrome oxidase subunit 3